jgi:hypothetical protein
MLNRAMILRRALKKRSNMLFDAEDTLRIDPGVLAAFLNVFKFRHGARSIEAIVEMSQLQDREQFEPPLLPPPLQMQLHVDPNEFMRIQKHWVSFEASIEKIAEAIHEHFVAGVVSRETDPEKRKLIRTQRGRQEWGDLHEMYRESNRDQAAHIPAKLASVGCDMVPIQPGEDVKRFAFTVPEAQTLAELEHERFVAERSVKQPNHPDLKPWQELSSESRAKDLRHVKDLPEILRAAGRKIVRIK